MAAADSYKSTSSYGIVIVSCFSQQNDKLILNRINCDRVYYNSYSFTSSTVVN